MRLIEWEVTEDGYEEQINIPKEQRDGAKASARVSVSTRNAYNHGCPSRWRYVLAIAYHTQRNDEVK